MTTPTHAHPAMTPPADNPQPQPPDQAAPAEPELPSNAAADGQPAVAAASLRGTHKVNWAALGLGLIPAILTAGFVSVMIFAFTGLENRITSLEDRTANLEIRMTALENRVDARFAAQDAKIDALDTKIDAIDAKIDEINLKLTALIAALNMTEETDAAVAGELIASPPTTSTLALRS